MAETPFLRETMRIQWETELKSPAEAISAGLRESKAMQENEGRNEGVGRRWRSVDRRRIE
jgi:hypothetical protein